MTIGTDDFSAPAGLAPGSVTVPAPGSIAGPAPDSVTSPAPGSVAGPAPDSVIGLAPGVVAGRVAPVVINPTKSNYFYGKQVTVKNLTSSKLYMKGTIWIKGIPFGETGEAWNYMLGIPDNTRRAEVAEDLGHQFIFLAEKMGDGYQQFSDLVKRTWKETGMAKNTMTGIITRLRPHITANKEKGVFRSKTLAAIDKYWPGMGFYKKFYQIDEAAGSDRFFRRVGTVVRKYKGPRRIIVVWAINYFTAHRILNACIGVASDGYKHHITNDFEKLLKEMDGSENTSVITTPILLRIAMHIRSTGFLDDGALDVVFSPDEKIQEGSVQLLLKEFVQC